MVNGNPRRSPRLHRGPKQAHRILGFVRVTASLHGVAQHLFCVNMPCSWSGRRKSPPHPVYFEQFFRERGSSVEVTAVAWADPGMPDFTVRLG